MTAGEGDGIGGKERGRERARGAKGQEGREFGPSQCWKQIDAAVAVREKRHPIMSYVVTCFSQNDLA